ncbi:MAG: zf-TFIIB domain-containing protein [Pirellulales bacterium]|nr:zf-TFIIB domain-containing protein [Pirellulales bacterium]
MDCPLCSTELRRTTYEGLPLFACDTCSGYLVATNRVSAIERRREKNAEDLMQEAAPAKLKDNQEALRCPRCRGRMMKEFAKSPAEFHIDTCERCDVVWFDAGELALIQLTFEATAAGQDAARFQDRHRTMSSEEKQEFEQQLARLPHGNASLGSGFGEGFLDMFRRMGREWWI